MNTLYNKVMQATAEVIQNHENEHVCSIRQGEARHGKYKRLKNGGGQAYDVQVCNLPLFHKIQKMDMIWFAKPGLTEDLYIVHKERNFQ
jgi:hypothetical protein